MDNSSGSDLATSAGAPESGAPGARRVTSREAGDQASQLTSETGVAHIAVLRERVDEEGYTVSEWRVERSPAAEQAPDGPVVWMHASPDCAHHARPMASQSGGTAAGMSLDEARAHLAQANIERPLGRSWDELDRMQGGRLVVNIPRK